MSFRIPDASSTVVSLKTIRLLDALPTVISPNLTLQGLFHLTLQGMFCLTQARENSSRINVGKMAVGKLS